MKFEAFYCDKQRFFVSPASTLINLRESILMNRVAGQAESRRADLSKGVDYLERYFSLVAFSNYVHTIVEKANGGPMLTFSQWKANRPEVISMHERLRRRGVSVVSFRPLEDLAILSSARNTSRSDLEAVVRQVWLSPALCAERKEKN